MSQCSDGRNRLAAIAAPTKSEPVRPDAPARVRPGEPVSGAVRAALIRGTCFLKGNEPAALQGDAEGVHLMRTAARRLRGELRAFRPLIERAWTDELAGELRWLGRTLGAVRDLDVLRARLEREAADLRDPLEPLFDALGARHCAARAQMHEAIHGLRYHRLLERLEAAPAEIPLTPDADEACRAALPPLVRELWKPLKRKGRALEEGSSEEAFHLVRRRAKRVRYAAEVAARSLGKRTSRRADQLAKRAKDVQDVLGQYQDAIVARREIEDVTKSLVHPGPAFLVAAGRLLERQNAVARAARTDFFDAWNRLDRKRLRRWMTP